MSPTQSAKPNFPLPALRFVLRPPHSTTLRKAFWHIRWLPPLLLLIGLLGIISVTSHPLAQELPPLEACATGGFSTEEDFMAGVTPYDGNPYISDGDLLSFTGQVCARNADLLSAFGGQPDLGLDALDLILAEKNIIAFSTELDELEGRFTAGDLLFTNGIIIPNAALRLRFQIPHNVGLDGLHFVGEFERILQFIEEASAVGDWGGGVLQEMLQAFDIDIWFSIEGSWDFRREDKILDGDVLSARDGIVVMRQNQLLPSPAGIPSDGVDFGLDGLSGSRDFNREDLVFSTEILHEAEPPFTDGDILKVGGSVLLTNADIVTPFEPQAKFLGLDALSIIVTPLVFDPNIQEVCGDGRLVVAFQGGIVPVGSSSVAYTGLYVDPSDTNILRPCGSYIPIDGLMPDEGVLRFRTVFRKPTDPVPVVGDPLTRNIQTKWFIKTWNDLPFPFGACDYSEGVTLETDAQGWLDAVDYLEAKTGLDIDSDGTRYSEGCANSGLRLAVWNTNASGGSVSDAENDQRFVIWLEWEQTLGGLDREPADHYLQLDNTQPFMPVAADGYPLGVEVRLPDGSTVVPACGEAPDGTSIFQVWGDFKDDYYYGFNIEVKGGLPPTTFYYPGPTSSFYTLHYLLDDGSGFSNTVNTGTTGIGLQHLRNINMNDLGKSFQDCCYLLELTVIDRALLHSFGGIAAHPAGPWAASQFITFAAAP